MKTENSKTYEPHEFRLTLANNKYMALANLSIYYTLRNIKPAYNNNEFKISASIWNCKFDLPNG